MAAIECVGVSKSFPEAEQGRGALALLPRYRRVQAVKDVSFTVLQSEIYGILGPNGSGKSTLIRLLATLLYPDSGRIRIFGRDVVKEQGQVRRLINRVSVDAAFFKKLSALENLLYAARLYGLAAGEARQRMNAILPRLGFPAAKLDTPMENLSRGQQQKVAIARALMTSPVLILLDEPTTGLDPRSRREVQDFVLEVRSEHAATVILTSHDMQEAERLCDRVAFIEGGRYVAEGTPHQLKLRAGGKPTLEDVFLSLTGKSIDEE